MLIFYDTAIIPLNLPMLPLLEAAFLLINSYYLIDSTDFFLCVQDFADVIPGHGGLMDRFDCQMLMAFFANVYYLTFCR